MKLAAEQQMVLGLAVLGAGLVWWLTRPGVAGKAAQGVTAAVGEAAVGTVKGVGQWFGVPDTNQTQCQKDISAGKWWDASFSCPAGTYLGSAYDAGKAAVFGSQALSAAEAADARREYAATDPRRVDLPATNYDPLVNDAGMDFRHF